tara:strand:- start:73 stop:702 length:630 start_codon:yes stop_codon:yes gene_type:complete
MSSGLNTVNVFSIDEEKLKFRVTVSFSAPQIAQDSGEYKFTLPIPTALTNSHEYNSCLIDCNGFQAYALGGVADPVFTVAAGLVKVGCMELQLNIPSSQTVTTTNVLATDSGVGSSRVGGYRELLILECKSIGDGNGNVALAGRSACWTGISPASAIMCGNPFGQTLTIRNHDPISDDKVWLVSQGVGAGTADVGHYLYSFDITMIPNR